MGGKNLGSPATTTGRNEQVAMISQETCCEHEYDTGNESADKTSPRQLDLLSVTNVLRRGTADRRRIVAFRLLPMRYQAIVRIGIK